MSALLYYIVCSILAIAVLTGISMMSKVQTAVKGNVLSAVSLFIGVIITLIKYEVLNVLSIYVFIAIGLWVGYMLSQKVKMIQMPQMVALFNGVGGAASAIVGAMSLLGIGSIATDYVTFSNTTSSLALVIGMITLVGSLIAAGKLHRILPQRPIVFRNHSLLTQLLLISSLLAVVFAFFIDKDRGLISNPYFIMIWGIVFSSLFGYVFAIRVGGADMPITISLLNSLSGVAGAIAGMAIGDILLVSVGGIVGASGLLLTQIMCRAMNRSLLTILTGKTATTTKQQTVQRNEKAKDTLPKQKPKDVGKLLAEAKSVIIVPGYGMALAQAQHIVCQLANNLEANGTEVKYVIHPVAGRMPGHMSVLLAEADVPYEKLYEMHTVNDEFKDCDAVVVVGANDILNPSARDAVDTPIYGMPILNVDDAKEIIICNYDLKPGYAGVENPIYTRESGVHLFLGDAKDSLTKVISKLNKANNPESSDEDKDKMVGEVLGSARSVIIVPGYGMALAQAQHLVRQLADKLEANGTEVKYVIHPVAGRMPGHMSVLLAEADVTFEQLYEMHTVNDEFENCDAVVVVGANDILNPSARDAVDTPIYGMPILNVDKAKHIIICNYDLKPGYAGVENPIYTREDGVYLFLGDAKDSLGRLLSAVV